MIGSASFWSYRLCHPYFCKRCRHNAQNLKAIYMTPVQDLNQTIITVVLLCTKFKLGLSLLLVKQPFPLAPCRRDWIVSSIWKQVYTLIISRPRVCIFYIHQSSTELEESYRSVRIEQRGSCPSMFRHWICACWW